MLLAEAVVGAVAAKAVGAPVEVGAVIGGNAAIIGLGTDVALRRALGKPIGWETIEPKSGPGGKDALITDISENNGPQ